MTPTLDPVATVRDLLPRFRLGAPRGAGGLTLVPVLGGAPAADFRTAERATQDGTLAIEELGGGVVPELVVKNHGDLPVLFLDGEHLEGAKQNRVLNASVLVPARRDTVIPVSCVEQGRWRFTSSRRDFAPSMDHSYSELRSLSAQRVHAAVRAGRGRVSDQGAVWIDVERKRAQILAGVSPTSSMRDAYDDRRADLERIRGSVEAPAPDQTGVVAAAGGRVLAVDAFDRPATLAAYWDRLVRGYAVDALGAEPVPTAADASAATAYWAELADGETEATSHPGVGLGTDVILSSETLAANALTWDGAVVHLAAFPTTPGVVNREPRRHAQARIERPSSRAQSLRSPWFHDSDGAGGPESRQVDE